ncbi:hypothetical protein E4U60_007480 [Claviceps pazoutovae]|uniref:Uncharacterized protein n=1 Tax=Claviceps pazoutovae TaxID=1649127 RepID=A0A9P7MEN0_9HYPO|nr:hypothetical protein E4U60_007480 [Claviceps pazoutovae]
MDHKLWIDAIQQSPTAVYLTRLTRFRKRAEDMDIRQSAYLETRQPQCNGVWYLSWVVIFPNAVRCLKPLLAAAINQVDDKDLWKQVKKFVVTNSRIPKSMHKYTVLAQRGFGGPQVNSSEHRKDVDNLMSEELGQIHVDIS